MSAVNSRPPGGLPVAFSVPGSHGDAAPDSLLAAMRRQAEVKRAEITVTLDIPPYGGFELRATYGVLGTADLERYFAGVNVQTLMANQLSSNLDMLARACRSIEVYDRNEDRWFVLEDDAGPVTFDDRLARKLQWERPDDEFRYPVPVVYETMFEGNGFRLMTHVGQALEALGLADMELGLGESPGGMPTPSASPPPSGSTPPD